jgi:hypothetical protein
LAASADEDCIRCTGAKAAAEPVRAMSVAAIFIIVADRYKGLSWFVLQYGDGI